MSLNCSDECDELRATVERLAHDLSVRIDMETHAAKERDHLRAEVERLRGKLRACEGAVDALGDLRDIENDSLRALVGELADAHDDICPEYDNARGCRCIRQDLIARARAAVGER